MFPLPSGPILLLPVFPAPRPCMPPSNSLNSNASLLSSLPKSFPIVTEGRDDFFCVDPKSLTVDQLNEYRKEMLQYMNIEKNNLNRIQNDSQTRINAYSQGIRLAEETMKTNSMSSQSTPHSIFLPNFQPTDDGPIGCIDPKTLTNTQLQLYIEGITEELSYETKLVKEFEKESASRTDTYQNGLERANDELNKRKRK